MTTPMKAEPRYVTMNRHHPMGPSLHLLGCACLKRSKHGWHDATPEEIHKGMPCFICRNTEARAAQKKRWDEYVRQRNARAPAEVQGRVEADHD